MSFDLTNYANSLLSGPVIRDTGEKVSIPAPADAPEPEDEAPEPDEPEDPRDVKEFYQCYAEEWRD